METILELCIVLMAVAATITGIVFLALAVAYTAIQSADWLTDKPRARREWRAPTLKGSIMLHNERVKLRDARAILYYLAKDSRHDPDIRRDILRAVALIDDAGLHSVSSGRMAGKGMT